jgi:endonuclease G
MPPASKPLVGLLVMIVGAFLILAGCLALGGCLFLGLLQPQPGTGIPPGGPQAGRPDTGTEEPRPDPERHPAGEDQPTPEVGPVNPNVRFGMPAPAKADPESREAYLLDRPQYVLSYNAEKLGPNWVCWRLRAEDIGNVPRQPFEPDPDLPRGFAHVTPHDYDGSGFDRGHQCPAKDRSATEADSRAVFYMTNIVPQSPNSNQRGWERLEDYCRRLAREGHVLFIACGPHGAGGENKDGRRETEIGKVGHRITVPAELWKVVLVLPREDAEPRANTRVIAVVMPNDQSVGYDWTKYRTTAREVEKLTGYTFFRDVPRDVAEALRDHRDEVEVRVEQPRGRGREEPQ